MSTNNNTPLVVHPKAVVRWLGVLFDSKLSFKQHIQQRVALATAVHHGIRRLASSQHGLGFQALRRLYTSCVASVADYGVPVWWTNRNQQFLLAKFQAFRTRLSSHMLGAFRHSPL